MFQFTWFASYSYELAIGYLAVGFPIRISTGHKIFAPLRSFSQLVTSFIASWCLGILLVLFLTWPLLINISVYFQFNCLFKKFWLVFKLLWFSSFFKEGFLTTFVILVEIRRFELLTSCLQGRRSPNWANPPKSVLLLTTFIKYHIIRIMSIYFQIFLLFFPLGIEMSAERPLPFQQQYFILRYLQIIRQALFVKPVPPFSLHKPAYFLHIPAAAF